MYLVWDAKTKKAVLVEEPIEKTVENQEPEQKAENADDTSK